MGKNVENRLLIITVIVFIVGVTGISIPASRELFYSLTPLNLILCFSVAVLFQKKWTFQFILSLILIGCAGFAVEYAGVHTGVIFGEYHYGKTLGMSWEGIPFLIGLNWAALVYYASSMIGKSIKQPIIQATVGAGILTIFDWIMEPVAVQMDMWTWETKTIPLQNYAAWFAFAFLMMLIFRMLNKPESNRIASAMIMIQAAFFGILRLISYLN